MEQSQKNPCQCCSWTSLYGDQCGPTINNLPAKGPPCPVQLCRCGLCWQPYFTNTVTLPTFVWRGLSCSLRLPFAAHMAMTLANKITVPLLSYNSAVWVESLIPVLSLHNSFHSSQVLTVQIKLYRNGCPSFSAGKRTYFHVNFIQYL